MGLFTYKENTTPIPPNRFLQFFYLIKEHFMLFFIASICQFICTFPTIYILISTYIRYSTELNTENPDVNTLYQTLTTGALLLIPSLIISSLGEIGMYSIIKKIAFNDSADIKDFFKGIKKNFLACSPAFLVSSIFLALIIINYAVYLYGDLEAIVKLLSLIISVVMFTILSLCKPYFVLQKMLFNNSTIQITKNSIAFVFTKLFKNLAIFVLSNIFLLLLLFLSEGLRIIVIVLFIIFGGAYTTLMQYLHSLSVVELFINKQNYPEIYHNGLSDFYEVKE